MQGLNIKGKSAKQGLLSGFVPYLQISEERHKSRWAHAAYTPHWAALALGAGARTRACGLCGWAVWAGRARASARVGLLARVSSRASSRRASLCCTSLCRASLCRASLRRASLRRASLRRASLRLRVCTSPPSASVRVYYPTEALRESALAALSPVLDEMVKAAAAARGALADEKESGVPLDDEVRERHLENLRLAMDEPEVLRLDDAGFGLEMPERLMWEAYVMRQVHAPVTTVAGVLMHQARAHPCFLCPCFLCPCTPHTVRIVCTPRTPCTHRAHRAHRAPTPRPRPWHRVRPTLCVPFVCRTSRIPKGGRLAARQSPITWYAATRAAARHRLCHDAHLSA